MANVLEVQKKKAKSNGLQISDTLSLEDFQGNLSITQSEYHRASRE